MIKEVRRNFPEMKDTRLQLVQTQQKDSIASHQGTSREILENEGLEVKGEKQVTCQILMMNVHF